MTNTQKPAELTVEEKDLRNKIRKKLIGAGLLTVGIRGEENKIIIEYAIDNILPLLNQTRIYERELVLKEIKRDIPDVLAQLNTDEDGYEIVDSIQDAFTRQNIAQNIYYYLDELIGNASLK